MKTIFGNQIKITVDYFQSCITCFIYSGLIEKKARYKIIISKAKKKS